MVKKVNRDALLIKILIEKGVKQKDIVKLLHVKRQKVSYWANTEIKTTQKRRRKLNDVFVEKIREMAKNKTTSAMSSRKIASIINLELEKENVVDSNNKLLSIHHSTICNYLREFYGKPKKIRKAFFLNPEQMNKRVEYCQMILNRGINYDQIMFTDECIIDLSSYTNDSIRLDPDTQQQLKNGDTKVYTLVNRERRKFEKSLMICGGISYYGLSHLIFVEGTMNDFAYGQAILFFKDDIDEIRDKYGVKLIFEQDGAAVHKTKPNITLLNRLFTEKGWVQNSPNSPDLAYPIEDLWAILKPRVRRRNPNSINELKKYLLEEWSSIPMNLVQNLCKGFLDRIKKVIEFNGARLEPEHLKKKPSNVNYCWEIPETLPNMRVVYNDKKLHKYKKNEMKIIKSELKKLKSINIERMRKKIIINNEQNKQESEYTLLIRSVLNDEGPERALEEKNNIVKEVKNMLHSIKDMNIVDYIEHLKEIAKEKKDKDEQKNEEGIELQETELKDNNLEEIYLEQKISNLLSFKKIDKRIKYRIKC